MFRLRQPVLLGLLQPASLQWFLGVNKLYQLCNWEYLRDPGHHTDTQRLPSSHHFRNLVVDLILHRGRRSKDSRRKAPLEGKRLIAEVVEF